MKAGTGGSGTFANGAAARKIAADTSTTTSARRRSPRPAGSVDRNTSRSLVNSPGMPSSTPAPGSAGIQDIRMPGFVHQPSAPRVISQKLHRQGHEGRKGREKPYREGRQGREGITRIK